MHTRRVTLFSRLTLMLALAIASRPLLAAPVGEMNSSVRAIVSGIISYSRWPQLNGPPRLCIFSSSRYASALTTADLPPPSYVPVTVSTLQQAQDARCDAVYFGNESPDSQRDLKNHSSSRPQLFIAEQNAECQLGSAFCLAFKDDKVTFSVNLDELSRSGVRVNPDVLMLARSTKHE